MMFLPIPVELHSERFEALIFPLSEPLVILLELLIQPHQLSLCKESQVVFSLLLPRPSHFALRALGPIPPHDLLDLFFDFRNFLLD